MSNKTVGRSMSEVLREFLKNISPKRLRIKFVITSLLIGTSLALTSCGGTPAALPDPEIKIYLLDLTGSGDVSNQFRLIEDDLLTDITTRSLGSPYTNEGPSLTRFYFVGTNSRALREFSLQDRQAAYDLYQYIDDENNNTRTEDFWKLLSEKYQNYMIEKIESNSNPTKADCLNEFDGILLPTFSADRVRKVYSSFMCRMTIYGLSNFEQLRIYINEQSQPGVQKASDVFGALSKINSQVLKYQAEYPESNIRIILATDGDHNLGGNSPSNLRANIKATTDICGLAEKYRNEFELSNLVNGPRLEIDARGISALTKGMGEYPRELESFWNCFFPNE